MSLFEQIKALVNMNSLLMRAVHVDEQYENALAEHLAGRHQQAFALAKPLADAGHLPAQNLLGTMYLLGQGVQESGSEALFWLNKAYSGGYKEAAAILGMALVTGKAGMPINMEKGKNLLAEAVGFGDADAQLMLNMIEAKQGIFAKPGKQKRAKH